MELVTKQKVEALFSPALTGKTTYTADEILLTLQTMPTVEAIPIKDIKDFLRCEKIDSCDWRNCSECSQMKCISIRNLSDLIEWSKGRENEAK